ncbi:hypothetical protein DMH25_28375 [Streptomyces sp. WAC 01325]|nr:hypothetical protein DMH25_28375 [Streptomyces sp. WAC 01325]
MRLDSRCTCPLWRGWRAVVLGGGGVVTYAVAGPSGDPGSGGRATVGTNPRHAQDRITSGDVPGAAMTEGPRARSSPYRQKSIDGAGSTGAGGSCRSR